MATKLSGIGCLVFALGAAARPAPADLFPCSCGLCASAPSGMVCRGYHPPCYPSCATYSSTYCS